MTTNYLMTAVDMPLAFRAITKVLLLTTVLTLSPASNSHAGLPIAAVIKEGVKKAIKALDLHIQRLQNKTIGLQNAAKVIENKLSQLRLKEIAEWGKRQRDLYGKYYDELWKVRSTVSAYKRIRLITKRQEQLVKEYKFTWHMVRLDKHFTKSEVDYMYRVYTGMINESVSNLEQVLLVVNSYKTQMSDAKRLEIINKAGDNIDQNYADLQAFNNENIRLSIARAKDQHEVETLKKLYGLQ